ncbi:MAG: helix-turn-helix transcriptional regulator [Silvibacterium sp.]
MEGIGSRLRTIRQKWGLTLREVEERSIRIAQQWGNPSYRISASWLDRVEREDRVLSGAKLIVLGVIYSLPPEELLGLYTEGNENPAQIDQYSAPNATLLLTRGPLEEYARQRLPDNVVATSIPEETMLLPPEDYLPAHYRRGIIGRQDKTLEPMVRAGTFVLINTQKRSIAHRREWTNEYERPIYFLYTRAGYLCGWCDLDRKTDWLTLVPHYASYTPARLLKYRTEVEVIGRVAAMLQRFEEQPPMA